MKETVGVLGALGQFAAGHAWMAFVLLLVVVVAREVSPEARRWVELHRRGRDGTPASTSQPSAAPSGRVDPQEIALLHPPESVETIGP